jgi:phosphocarrier protein
VVAGLSRPTNHGPRRRELTKSREGIVERREVEIANEEGLNARMSGQLVQLASKYLSDVSISRSGRKVNAKSSMGVMMLAAGPGSHVLIETDGPDEVQAIEAIAALIGGDFVGNA